MLFKGWRFHLVVEILDVLDNITRAGLSQHEQAANEFVGPNQFQMLGGSLIQVAGFLAQLALILEQRPIYGALERDVLQHVTVLADVAATLLKPDLRLGINYNSAHI